MASNTNNATGRRKTAVARIILTSGKGNIVINNKKPEEYFNSDLMVQEILTPFKVTNTLGSFDVLVNVNGGGINGQAGAIKLGISRALIKENSELRAMLKPEGLLTRDSREVERKKYGRPKARKRFQFSKR
jgi:small subunit ribosomal protein S9